jgi:hypothetical protein
VAGDLPASFRYAAQGLSYGFRSQRNFRIHVFTGLVVFLMGLALGLPPAQLAVLVLTVAAVLVLELINTATEAVVDLAIEGAPHRGLEWTTPFDSDAARSRQLRQLHLQPGAVPGGAGRRASPGRGAAGGAQ